MGANVRPARLPKNGVAMRRTSDAAALSIGDQGSSRSAHT